MNVKKFPKILYFIAGSVPTEEDYEAAEQYGHKCAFRNASKVAATGCLEKCDGVAGLVPESYSELPTGKEAMGQMKLSFQKKAEVKPKAKPKAEPKKKAVEGSDAWKPNA